MKEIKVTATKLKNIQDKDLLYIVIGEGANKVIINVGKKTWEAVDKLVNPTLKGGK